MKRNVPDERNVPELRCHGELEEGSTRGPWVEVEEKIKERHLYVISV